jgi:hypothetical protein
MSNGSDEDIQAALCVIAKTAPDDPKSVDISPYGAGDISTLAQMLAATVNDLIQRAPGFEEEWTKALRINRLLEVEKMERAKPEANAIIQKLKAKEPKQ